MIEDRIPTYSFNTVIVGSGAAGYNAADCLYRQGQRDIAVVTEHRLSGTSRNTGSDKQTYYKAFPAGDTPDSVRDPGGSAVSWRVRGRGSGSLRGRALRAVLLKLAELGVPFPEKPLRRVCGLQDGPRPQQAGHQRGAVHLTNYDRAPGAGSDGKNIPILEPFQAIRVLTDGEECAAFSV